MSEKADVAAERAAERAAELNRIGARIRNFRLEANLTQADFGEACGMHRISVIKLESGRLDVGVSKVRAIAKALGVQASDLID